MDSGAPGSVDSRLTLCSGVSRMTKDEGESCEIPGDLGLSEMKKWKHEVRERSAWATPTHFAEIPFQEMGDGGDSVVECSLTICKALGLIPSTKDKTQKKQETTVR